MSEFEFAALVGLDWGDTSHEVALWDEQRQTRTSERVEHTPAALRAWIKRLHARFEGARIAVAIEQSRGAVFDALSGFPFVTLYPINPRSAARYREAFHPSGSKDDPTDAASLLDLLRKHRDQLRAFVPDDPSTRLLRLLTEDRRELVDQRTQHIQRVTDRLKTYYPQALRWAGALTTAQACDFLERWPTLHAIQRARPSAIRAFYERHRHAAAWIDQRLAEIRAGVTFHDDPVIIDTAALLIGSEVTQLRALNASIATYDQKISSAFATHQDAPIFASFPGAGEQLAPRLAAALGTDRNRFDSAAAVAAFTGIAPVLRRSGNSVTVQMRWACPKFIRQTFHEFARVSIGQSAWARAFYKQQRARGHGQHQAIRTLAYRWIRIVFACWNNRTTYDESRYLQQLASRGSALVKAAA
ncbi:MAG TPA: IS110 family transposase [Thermoanaerobaculia bacterium]|nr:IS110 family transposase [Thermoanaerobaculia bacterium]